MPDRAMRWEPGWAVDAAKANPDRQNAGRQDQWSTIDRGAQSSWRPGPGRYSGDIPGKGADVAGTEGPWLRRILHAADAWHEIAPGHPRTCPLNMESPALGPAIRWRKPTQARQTDCSPLR
jgi:hypothetical protein